MAGTRSRRIRWHARRGKALLALACLLAAACAAPGRGAERRGASAAGDDRPSEGARASSAVAAYYADVDSSSRSRLRATLHALIDDHARIPYTSSATDTWDVLELADEDPGDGGAILDLYRNRSIPKRGGGGGYDREHTWPKSYGFPRDGVANMPYTDCHMLRLADSGANSARGNKPYGDVGSGGAEKPTEPSGGVGGGSGTYPGWSNWSSGGADAAWEVWIDRRGDVARALFYMDVRYEGGTHGATGAPEPDLALTDDRAAIEAGNTGANESVASMGLLSALLAWHAQDPVDDKERHHNDVVAEFQGNRNPFVDHPEWVALLFGP